MNEEERWYLRLTAAMERNEPLKVTPAEFHALRQMEIDRIREEMLRDADDIRRLGVLGDFGGWPVVVEAPKP